MIELRGAATFGSGTSPSKAATASGSGPAGLACRVPGALESGEQARAATPAFKSSNALVAIAGGVVDTCKGTVAVQ